nr:phage tail fiber protein [uncultured Mediterranean phage uvMED]
MAQVSSYNVANRSGALVRSDINDIYSAIKTCNSGPNDPASPEKFMLFGDSTTGDDNLKIHDGSNFRIIGKVTEDNLGLLPRAGGTMTGVLVVSAGSSSAAGLTLGDSSTGLYRQGTNQLNITVSGTRKIDIDSNGLQVRGQADVRFADSDSSHYVALQAPSSVSSSITLTLPSTIVADSFLKTDGSGNLSFGTPDSVPTGCVFCRAIGTVPAGYLECNGAAVSRSTYSVLFGIIQTQYGGGNGSTTFNLPDLRGEFIRGWASNGSVDSGRQIGSSQGSDNLSHNHTISSSVNDSGHSHTIGLAVRSNYAEPRNFGVGRDGNANNSDSTSTQTTGISVSSSAANSGGSEARPRNVAMMYIIKI